MTYVDAKYRDLKDDDVKDVISALMGEYDLTEIVGASAKRFYKCLYEYMFNEISSIKKVDEIFIDGYKFKEYIYDDEVLLLYENTTCKCEVCKNISIYVHVIGEYICDVFYNVRFEQ